jgi:type IV fimbrial biogenesis protein FimT
MNRTCLRAFTLIELLITTAVFSVLLSIAVPSLGSLMERNQQTTTTHDLLTALSHARGLAINRRELVSLCAGIDSCEASANWEKTIFIFSDPNRNGQFDAGEQLHRVVTLPDRYRWNWSNFRSKTFMSFKANGTTNSLNGTYTLCSGSEAIQQLAINITGRLRTRSPKDNSACS